MLRDDGVGVIEYTEQLTYLLFLKMAHERANRKIKPQQIIPEEYSWSHLMAASGDDLEREYTRILNGLARQDGVIGTISRKAQNRVTDPACGTGGFLLVAHEHASAGVDDMTPNQRHNLQYSFASGVELVDGTARLASMNLLLHGMGSFDADALIEVRDSLSADPGERWSVVLSNPPFGRKSSVTMVGEDGRESKDGQTIERQDFVATTSNKQLNFVQHIMTILETSGRAAVVLPDNVLFEGGAGETIRRKLLTDYNLHTMLRLPTGIFYAQGVKANVLFFDKKMARPGKPWTEKLWVYDLRTNKHFTLKQNPLTRADLDDFVEPYKRGALEDRVESERWKAFTYDEIVARDKANLDITWLRDESLEDLDSLPSPDVIAREIVEDLTAALAEFEAVASALEEQLGESAPATPRP